MTDAGGRTQMRIRQRQRASQPSAGSLPSGEEGCLGFIAAGLIGVGLASYFFGSSSKEEAMKAKEALHKPEQVEVLKGGEQNTTNTKAEVQSHE